MISLPPDLRASLNFPPEVVANRIRERVDLGREQLGKHADTPEAFNSFRANRSKWDDVNRDLLRRLFKGDAMRSAYDRTGQIPQGGGTQRVELERLRGSLEDRVRLLEAVLQQIEPMGSASGDADARGSFDRSPVFVAHFGDAGLARTVARALEAMRLTPVIVSTRPGEGEFGITQLDAYPDARFAVVLVAGDLAPGPGGKGSGTMRTPHGEALLCFGYLAGRLGRKRVCGLHQPGIYGVGRELALHSIELDEGEAWKGNLARRIEASTEGDG